MQSHTPTLAISKGQGNGGWEVVEIDHHLGHVDISQAQEDVFEDRAVGDRDQRFGELMGEGAEAGSEAA